MVEEARTWAVEVLRGKGVDVIKRRLGREVRM